MTNITSNTYVAKPATAAKVLVLALCVSVGVAGVPSSHSHFRSAAQAAAAEGTDSSLPSQS
jgi:hypothetical protein